MNRTCVCCHQPKPTTDYYPSSSSSNRPARMCKACRIKSIVQRRRLRKARDREAIEKEISNPTQHGQWCLVCYGLPWRRPIDRVCRCGGSYAAEEPIMLDPFSRRDEPDCGVG